MPFSNEDAISLEVRSIEDLVLFISLMILDATPPFGEKQVSVLYRAGGIVGAG